MLRLGVALWLLGVGMGIAAAQALELKGEIAQGGLVMGQAAPGSKITLDGRNVPLAEDGKFAIGFGRDAAPVAQLVAVAPDGKIERRSLTIVKRSFPEQRVDGLPPDMVTPPPRVLERIRREVEKINALRRIITVPANYATLWQWPAQGPITGVYGSQRVLNGQVASTHYGLDIGAPSGSPIVAPAAGTVMLAEDLYFTGLTVIVDHGLGVNSTYAHLSVLAVGVGQKIAAGQKIGAVGATGRATGPHLHWGLNWFEVRLDPGLLVPPPPPAPARN